MCCKIIQEVCRLANIQLKKGGETKLEEGKVFIEPLGDL